MNPVPFILSLSYAVLLAIPPSTPPVRPAQILENATSFTGPVTIRTFAEGTFCYTAFQATQQDLPAKMKEMVPQFVKALVASNLGTKKTCFSSCLRVSCGESVVFWPHFP